MPQKPTLKKNRLSGGKIEMVGKHNLWMLKAENNEAIAGCPRSDEILYQENLFQMLKEKSLNPMWITSKDCLERKFECDDFYVLPVFRGKVFRHLVSMKYRVYGALALTTCLKRKERLPKRHSPVWSITLLNAIVCFSGIEMKTRKQQILLVKMMGGTISKAFTKKVTHLVADSQDTKSKKFVTAVDYAVPVLSPSWIFAAWKSAKTFNEKIYTTGQFVSEHKLHIFAKCVISCSGIAPQDRSTLSHLIEANGGVYTGNMKKNYCTHLVTNLNSGEKYKNARKWGWNQIRIVRLRWVTKSVEKGYRLPERLYETGINSAIECSTPRASQLTSSQPLTNLEVSAIDRSTGEQQITDSWEDNGSLSNDIPRKSGSVMAELSKPIVTGSNWLKAKPSQRATVQLDPISIFDLNAICFNDFMSNCIIYLCGIANENFKKYKWLTNKVGSGRRDKLVYTDTTHVVVGPQRLDWELIKQLKEKACNNVKVVTCDWLLDCAKAQRVLNESSYLIFKQEKSSFEFSPGTLNVTAMKGLHHNDESETKTTLKITELGTKLLGKAAGMLANAELESAEEIWKSPKSINDERGSGVRNLFTGLTFRIVVCKEEIRDKLFSDIESHGGKVEQKTEIWVDYMVCEVLDFLLNDNATNFNCANIVSSFWLQDCVENNAVLDAEKHPLYRPIEIFETFQIFDGHVVGLGTLREAEKDIYADILYKFGADVKNHLGEVQQFNICTEIVSGAEIERANFERQWQIPVLDPSWVIESIIQNQLQPVQSHLFDNQLFKNYTRSDRLWMHATQRKRSDDRSNMQNSVQNFGNARAEDPMPKNLDQNVLNEKSLYAVKNSQKRTDNNLAAVLDLADAFAYVDEINTQSSLSTSPDETWNDVAVSRALGEAAIKTAEARCDPCASSISRANSDYIRMQTRQNKRNAEPASLTDPAESCKKAKITTSENSDPIISKDEKKRKIAEKLAKLAVQREQYMQSVEAEKKKQREQEEKTKIQVRAELPKRSKKRNVDPPEPEYYGWKENSPRPIATQILNPFDPDPEENEVKTHEFTKQNQANKISTAKKYGNAVGVITPDVPNKAICFTSTEQHDRNALATMVLELGGQVCDEFSEKVTHLVCSRIVRNEKLLCSMAKGLVIVDEDYIVDSHAQSKWLEIDNYEWGSAHSVTKHGLLSSQRFLSFALACPRWRRKIEKNPNKRAFHNWKALLYCGRRRFTDLKRIICFGGGEAYFRDDICSLEGFTVALVEKSKFWNSQVSSESLCISSESVCGAKIRVGFKNAICFANLQIEDHKREVAELIKNNVQCFDIDYLATYLTIENECEVRKYFHKDYVTALNHMDRKQLL